MPGVGKTTLAQTLARVLGLDWSRLQFTSDMLPADIVGVSIFDRNTNKFQFRRGPVFTQLLLADEINRASPKAQSALLEAMEERQVSIDGVTYRLPDPFFVVATQNPHEQIGTYGLPESQLDRFLMRVIAGLSRIRHPSARCCCRASGASCCSPSPRCWAPAEVLAAATRGARVSTSFGACSTTCRRSWRIRAWLPLGLSPRAAQGLLRAAQGWALLAGERAVIPEHVQAVLPAVASHRLEPRDAVSAPGGAHLIETLLTAVAVPV